MVYLLVKGDLLHEGQVLGAQVGLLGAIGGGAAQLQVVIEAVAEGTPCVKQTLQALDIGLQASCQVPLEPSMLPRRQASTELHQA